MNFAALKMDVEISEKLWPQKSIQNTVLGVRINPFPTKWTSTFFKIWTFLKRLKTTLGLFSMLFLFTNRYLILSNIFQHFLRYLGDFPRFFSRNMTKSKTPMVRSGKTYSPPYLSDFLKISYILKRNIFNDKYAVSYLWHLV